MSQKAIEGLKPELFWQRFYEISQIPRPSKKEEKVLEYLRKLAKELNLPIKEDATGNILISVPATKGYEKSRTIVLQSHVDMVCEKNKGTEHDFDNDPIKLIRDGEWIKADGTTLGADNGIGVAAALSMLTEKDVIHGPLECLFTVDEETGLTGANNLQPGFLTGKILLNMDSEEDGAFYIGCSGGMDTQGVFEIQHDNAPGNFSMYSIFVSGLKGGHSGMDIITGRGNAIKILARALRTISSFDFYVVQIEGGSKRNAIPREAEAIIMFKESDFKALEQQIKEFEKHVQNEFKTFDAGVKISISKKNEKAEEVFQKNFSEKIINVLLGLPHGIIAMSGDIPGLVETSTNLATVVMNNQSVIIGTSQRSSIESAKRYIASSVESVFKLAKAEVTTGDGYPGWKPNLDSEVLKISKKVYKDMYGKEPELKAIHAGLETGILGDRYPGLDMISFGPTISGAHSPDEKVHIPAVEKFFKLLAEILKELAKQNK